jgi:hypothetical protein
LRESISFKISFFSLYLVSYESLVQRLQHQRHSIQKEKDFISGRFLYFKILATELNRHIIKTPRNAIHNKNIIQALLKKEKKEKALANKIMHRKVKERREIDAANGYNSLEMKLAII